MKKFISILLSVLMLFSVLGIAASAEGSDVLEYAGHKYKRFDQSMTWTEAKDFCESLGGYLATVTSSGENDFINSLVQSGEKSQYWLGATDERAEGRWEWVTGEKFCYLPLQRSFDNAYGVEDYLQVQRHNWGDYSFLGYWNDSANDNTIKGEESFYSLEHVGFICEWGSSEMQMEYNLDAPVIYVIGRTGIVRADGSGIIREDTSFMTGVIMDNEKLLIQSVLKNDYKEFSDNVYNAISDVYKDYRLNENGEVTNGSHNVWSWSENTIPAFQGDIYTYRFEYDARLDPCDIADDLHDYITAIKATTGYDKVSIVSRCLGCNIATAYVTEYGWDDLKTFVMFASAAKGYDFVGEMFAGKFKFNADSVNYYLEEHLDAEDSDAFEDEALLELAKATIARIENNGTLKIGTAAGQRIYNKIAAGLVPRLLLATYATCPGYWAMVNDDNYEQAKQYIFGAEAGTTYAELVKKLDNYHYGVMNNVESTLKKMKADGVKINVLCKYGFQTPPFIESSEELGDNRIDVTSQSMGATTANTASTLSNSYIKSIEARGDGRYISPDKQIDGSTALFPDCTWYVKNNVHNTFYDCFNPYMMEMCRSEEQFTIDSDSTFPQYLFFSDGNVTPLTGENMNNIVYTTTFWSAFIRFFKALSNFFKSRLFGWVK